MKRGQFTLFVVLGLVIILLVGFVIYYFQDTLSTQLFLGTSSNLVLSPEAQEYHDAIEACAKWSADTTLLSLGQQGGYTKVPEPNLNFTTEIIPYYLYKGSFSNLITEDLFLEQFKEGFDTPFQSCLEQIHGYGDTLQAKRNFNYTPIISNDVLTLSITAPFTLYLQNQTYQFEDFSVTEELPFTEIFNSAQFIMDAHKDDSNSIPLSKLLEYFTKDNIITLQLNRENQTVLYSLIVKNSTLRDIDYTFQFAVEYNWIQEEQS